MVEESAASPMACDRPSAGMKPQDWSSFVVRPVPHRRRGVRDIELEEPSRLSAHGVSGHRSTEPH